HYRARSRSPTRVPGLVLVLPPEVARLPPNRKRGLSAGREGNRPGSDSSAWRGAAQAKESRRLDRQVHHPRGPTTREETNTTDGPLPSSRRPLVRKRVQGEATAGIHVRCRAGSHRGNKGESLGDASRYVYP